VKGASSWSQKLVPNATMTAIQRRTAKARKCREVPREGTRTGLARGVPTSRSVRVQLPFEPWLLPCPFRISAAGFAAPLQHRTAKADQPAPNNAQDGSRRAARFSASHLVWPDRRRRLTRRSCSRARGRL
jgi:hypothetical protein